MLRFFFLTLTSLGFCRVVTGIGCDPNCKDTDKICDDHPTIACTNKMIAEFKCRKTCKICHNSCDDYNCATDCNDISLMCKQFVRYCNTPLKEWRDMLRSACPQTCGRCQPCSNMIQCSNSCEDVYVGHCRQWALDPSKGCNSQPWMKEKCPKSCGVCRKCVSQSIHVGSRSTTSRVTTTTTLSQTRKPTQTVPTTQPRQTPSKPLLTASQSRPVYGPTNPNLRCQREKTLNQNIREQCLAAHNYYRCLYEIQELMYDEELAVSAQVYADQLSRQTEKVPSPIGSQYRGIDIGENIAWRKSGPFDVDDAVVEWHAEGLKYDFDTFVLDPKAEHYTQLIWAETAFVGCAVKQQGTETYVVAHYKTRGNINDENYIFSNLYPPLQNEEEQVCRLQCALHSCLAYEQKPTCRCKKSESKRMYPDCEGQCSVHCAKPLGHTKTWNESCEGATSCVCDIEGHGATCH